MGSPWWGGVWKREPLWGQRTASSWERSSLCSLGVLIKTSVWWETFEVWTCKTLCCCQKRLAVSVLVGPSVLTSLTGRCSSETNKQTNKQTNKKKHGDKCHLWPNATYGPEALSLILKMPSEDYTLHFLCFWLWCFTDPLCPGGVYFLLLSPLFFCQHMG